MATPNNIEVVKDVLDGKIVSTNQANINSFLPNNESGIHF